MQREKQREKSWSYCSKITFNCIDVQVGDGTSVVTPVIFGQVQMQAITVAEVQNSANVQGFATSELNGVLLDLIQVGGVDVSWQLAALLGADPRVPSCLERARQIKERASSHFRRELRPPARTSLDFDSWIEGNLSSPDKLLSGSEVSPVGQPHARPP